MGMRAAILAPTVPFSFTSISRWCFLLALPAVVGCANAAGVARARAASDLGCDKGQIEVTSLGGTSYSAEGCGESRVYDCAASDFTGDHTTNFVCVPERSAAPSPPARSAKTATGPSSPTDTPKRTDAAAPTGAAGFTFGSTVDEARTACEEKFAWTSSAPDAFECSGTPKSIGLAARSALKFCGEGLCRAVFLVRPESAESNEWLRQLLGLKGSLAVRYGNPVEDKDVPSSCTGDILACVREGLAHVKYSWTFRDGTYIVLALGSAPGPEAVIRLTYGRPEVAQAPAL
jgi:hypothetical protein